MSVASEPSVGVTRLPRPLTRRLMHWIRRTHLFLGLFLLPWALLYGVTAFLFNHPNAFADQLIRLFGPDEFHGTALADFPSPAGLAEQVVAALNARRKTLDGGPYRLVQPGQAGYSDDFLFASSRGDGELHAIRFDPVTGNGSVRSRPQGSSQADVPFAVKSGLEVDAPLPQRFQQAMPEVLDRLGVKGEDVVITSAPELAFLMEAEGRLWKVRYDMERGGATAQPADQASDPLTTRRFLLRLHLAHGYPSSPNVRWAWAVFVDAMAFTMVFWGLSGLLMWWQIKIVRTLGSVFLALSVVVASLMVVGMYQVLSG
jgi:hypothetical protein